MRKTQRTYRYVNLKLRRRLMALGLAAFLGVGSYALIKSDALSGPVHANGLNDDEIVAMNTIKEDIELEEPVYTELPVMAMEPTYTPEPVSTPEPVINNFNKGDSVVTTSNVNMRLNATKDSFKIGEVPYGSTIDRIAAIGNWDLIKYNNQLAFVSSDYTVESEYDYNNEYYTVEEYNDIVRTTSKLYFRTGPSKSESDICLLDKNEELIVIGKAVLYNDSNDIWYLVKYQDKIGFVKAEYTRSLKSVIQSMDPSITNVEIKKVGYFKEYTNIYNYNGTSIKGVDAYQTCKILEDKGDYYLVECYDTLGLVPKSSVKTYKGTFVVVDLSDQKVYMYCNTDMVFSSVCTTGSDSRKTDVGAFNVYERSNQRYFSEEAQARYLWANFDNGNGFHDAPWEPANKFGNNNYRKNNGSKGCVRLPDEAALFLRDYIKKGTDVLIKK